MRNLSTSNSKTKYGFVAFIGSVLLFVVLVILALKTLTPKYLGTYNAILADKAKLIEETPGARIVLVGNSNVAYGFDSSILEEEFGMPTINLGFTAEVGNAFNENLAKLNVHEGDIYILLESGYSEIDNQLYDPMCALISLEERPDLIRLVSSKDRMDVIRCIPTYLKRCLELQSLGESQNNEPDRSCFNAYGDQGTQRMEMLISFDSPVNPTVIEGDTFERLNALNRYFTDRGATLLISVAPIGNGTQTADPGAFEAVTRELAEGLDAPVISNPIDYMFEYNYFFNSTRHLNNVGAGLRTEQLIQDLRRYLEEGGDANLNRTNSDDGVITDVSFSHTEDIDEYLKMLSERIDDLDVLVVWQATEGALEVADETSERMAGKLAAIGFDAPVGVEDFDYIYVFTPEKDEMNCSAVGLNYYFETSDKRLAVEIASKPGDSVSITIFEGHELGRHVYGPNILVYNHETHRLLDCVGVELYDDSFSLIRY